MTNDDKNLPKRLRDCGLSTDESIDVLMREAADRIENLSAQVAALTHALRLATSPPPTRDRWLRGKLG